MPNQEASSYKVLQHEVGQRREGRILRRIVEVEIVLFERPPMRRVTLNCGHQFNLPRGLYPSKGKLTPCPECR